MNNNEFFGVDEKYIPESENVNVEYTKKDKKKFNVFLIILLVSLPVVIIMAMYIMRLSMIKLRYNNDTIQETLEAKSDLHNVKEQIQIASEIHKSSLDVMEEASNQMKNTQISMFNAQFDEYLGIQKGSSTKALYQVVIANNQTYQNDTAKQVKVKGIKDISEVESKKTYNVDFNYNSAGYINEIVITEAE